ncbi:unnamed protein product [Schistosoma intercalatum]|nr:unnamed protein product [Schistosoma intercalatum]
MERMRQDHLCKFPPCSLNFNSQLAGLKNSIGLWEDMINKTSKLSASLKTVIQCIGGFLEAFQKIADCAYGSNCGLKDLGSSMTRFCLRERGLESRLRTFNSQLTECLTAPLVDRLEEWKRSVAQLDRENGKEWRRAKSELQRATCELEKLSKRSRRKGSSASSCTVGGINGSVDSSSHNEIYAFSTMQSIDSNNNTVLHSGDNMHLNFVQHDLILKQQTLAELERVSLRRAVVEERRRFAELLTCLKPVLDSKLAIFGDVSLFEESIQAITHSLYDPNQIPSDIEEAIDYAVGLVTSNVLCDRKYSTSFGSGTRSDSRCTIRSTKHSTSSTTIGNGLEYSNSTGLSCHASELSLQSSISVSTNGSWNNSNNNCISGGSGSNYSQSTIHASEQHCDVLNPTQNSGATDNLLSHTAGGGVGDSVSLFENPDGSISGESGSLGRPVPNSVLDSINPDWIPLPGLSNKSMNVNERQKTSSKSTQDNAVYGFPSENFNNNENDNRQDFNHERRTSNVDVSVEADADDGGGGAGGTTTEDTEDGETDDEKLDHSDETRLDKSHQVQTLYPNQAIPSPVYTNLNELKKAAARKFQSRNSPTVNNINNNSNNNETILNNDSSSLYTSRKFSLPSNESMLTPTVVADSLPVSDINKVDPGLPQSSHFIWPPITTLDNVSCDSGGQEINSRSLCNTTHMSSVNNNNNVSSLWEYNHLITTDQTTSPFLHPTSITQSSGYLATTLSPSLSSNGNEINTTNNLCDASQSSASITNGDAIGYINTIVNSGTSTFRRRQSEYFKKSLDSTISSGKICSSPPPPGPPLSPSSVKNSNYASVTPGLIRRGSQAYQQTPHIGNRLYDRPLVHPPRRSSSVSRELVSHNSSLNNINTVNNNNSLLTTNHHQHSSRLNLSDFAGNKNPSLFNSSLMHEQSTTTNNNNSNIHHHYQQQPQLNFLHRTSPNCSVASMLQQNHYRQLQQQPSIQQEMFPSSCTPSISSANNNISHCSRIYSGNSNNNNGIVGRGSPIPGNNIDSNPSGTTNSQLMFGVKVLPNVVTPQLLNNTNSNNPSNHHQSRLPQRGGLMRQTSCEPSVISGSLMNNTIGGGGSSSSLSRSQMNSTLLTDRQSSQEFMQQQQQFHYASNIHNSRQSSFLQSQHQASGVGDSTLKGQQHQLFTDDGVTSFIE